MVSYEANLSKNCMSKMTISNIPKITAGLGRQEGKEVKGQAGEFREQSIFQRVTVYM
jgi:hypothetical protein